MSLRELRPHSRSEDTRVQRGVSDDADRGAAGVDEKESEEGRAYGSIEQKTIDGS
jgi:hypothetical protein